MQNMTVLKKDGAGGLETVVLADLFHTTTITDYIPGPQRIYLTDLMDLLIIHLAPYQRYSHQPQLNS